jgi:hypothetical protein
MKNPKSGQFKQSKVELEKWLREHEKMQVRMNLRDISQIGAKKFSRSVQIGADDLKKKKIAERRERIK